MTSCRCGLQLPQDGSPCASCGARTGGKVSAIGCLARLAAWGVVVLFLRLAFAGGGLRAAVPWAFGFVFGRSLGSVVEAAVSVIAVTGFWAVLLQAALGGRAQVLNAYCGLVAKALLAAGKFSIWVFRAAYFTVEGKPPPSLNAPARKPAREKEGD